MRAHQEATNERCSSSAGCGSVSDVDVVGGAYGAGSITYKRFHSDYMRRLLSAALDWARAGKRADLAAALESALTEYDAALQGKGW